MTTYANGKRIRYPRPHDWVRRETPRGTFERGMVTSVGEDGTVTVEFDEGDGILYQPDVLELHHTGWYWIESEPEEDVRTWG